MKTIADCERDLLRAAEILRSHDIEIDLWGCGCCSSPEIKFSYKGELIVEMGNAKLKMSKPNEGEK